MTANNATNLRDAFQDAARAVDPLSPTAPDTLKAVNQLVDALKAFADANTGTNTGDQTITLTGDVSGTGDGEFATTIAAGAVTAAKLDDGILKVLVFTGADASVEPAAATLTGAYAGDVVVSVTNLTDLSDASAVFEGVITVEDEIQQSESNLSAKTLLVILIAKGVAEPEPEE